HPPQIPAFHTAAWPEWSKRELIAFITAKNCLEMCEHFQAVLLMAMDRLDLINRPTSSTLDLVFDIAAPVF
uniref:hypothetical protein n=1 Tax=Planococcus sp. CAU13 TaxID=1541197 RepID=UPI001F259542